MSHDNNSRLVYSTDGGMIKESAPAQHASPSPPTGSCASAARPRDARAGVISIHGVPADQQKALATLLKKKCGTGGGLKEGVIEIQGDKRDLIKAELEKAGFQVKLVGDNSPSRALPHRGFSLECPLPSRGVVSPRTRSVRDPDQHTWCQLTMVRVIRAMPDLTRPLTGQCQNRGRMAQACLWFITIPSPVIFMEALLTSTISVAIAEIGDKTQLLALLLICRFRKPWPIIAGMLAATLLNHAGAAWIGNSSVAGWIPR